MNRMSRKSVSKRGDHSTFVLALILLTLVAIAFVLDEGGRFPTIEMTVEQSEKGFSRDAAYTGAATIVGFAAFGSIVMTAVRGSGKFDLDKNEAVAMYGGAAVAITAQGMVMLTACCLPFLTSSVFTMNIVTIAAGIATAFGVVHTVGRLAKLKKDTEPHTLD